MVYLNRPAATCVSLDRYNVLPTSRICSQRTQCEILATKFNFCMHLAENGLNDWRPGADVSIFKNTLLPSVCLSRLDSTKKMKQPIFCGENSSRANENARNFNRQRIEFELPSHAKIHGKWNDFIRSREAFPASGRCMICLFQMASRKRFHQIAWIERQPAVGWMCGQCSFAMCRFFHLILMYCLRSYCIAFPLLLLWINSSVGRCLYVAE